MTKVKCCIVYYNSYFLHRYQKVHMTTKVDLLATNSVPPIVPQEVAKESHAGHEAI